MESARAGSGRNSAWEITGIPRRADRRDLHPLQVHRGEAAAHRHLHGPARTPTQGSHRAQAARAGHVVDLTRRVEATRHAAPRPGCNTWATTLTSSDVLPATAQTDDVPLDVVEQIRQAVTLVVGEKRSTWTRRNLHEEASRQLIGLRFVSTTNRKAITGIVVDAAEQTAIRLTPSKLAVSPVQFHRAVGSSRLRRYASTVFSFEHMLQAEDRLLERGQKTTTPTCSPGDH